MSSSTLGAPSSLSSALSRIAYLEHQLSLAKRVVRERTGADLETWIEFAGRGEGMGGSSSAGVGDGRESYAALQGGATLSERPLGVAPPTAPTPKVKEPSPEEQQQEQAEEEEEPLDISPLVLRAIQLRKDLHSGRVAEENGEEELRKILEEGGGGGKKGKMMSEEQRETVRRWAGL